MAVAYLCTQSESSTPTVSDYIKLTRVIHTIQWSIHIPLLLGWDETGTLIWSVDASFAVWTCQLQISHRSPTCYALEIGHHCRLVYRRWYCSGNCIMIIVSYYIYMISASSVFVLTSNDGSTFGDPRLIRVWHYCSSVWIVNDMIRKATMIDIITYQRLKSLNLKWRMFLLNNNRNTIIHEVRLW